MELRDEVGRAPDGRGTAVHRPRSAGADDRAEHVGRPGEDGGAERARYGQTCPKRMFLCPSPCSPPSPSNIKPIN